MTEETNHCDKAAELRRIREELVTGQALSRGKFGEDDLQFARADLPRLDRLIAYHEAECSRSSGEKPRVRRRAITAGFKYC